MNDKFFNFTFGFIFVFNIIVIGGVLFLVGIGTYKLYNADYSNGIKPVLERVWCGSSGCTDKEGK